MLAEGAVCTKFKSGPRAGRPKYPPRSTWTRVIVSEAEIRAEEAAYEASTGRCHACLGKGEVSTGWSKAEGKKFGPCRRCGGRG